jgi:L-glyceraldehyde reductase
MSFGKTVKLPNADNKEMPQIGFGTWLSKPGEVEKSVEVAIKNGYRHIDLAIIYENQEEISQSFKKVFPSVCKRDEVFLTSKLWNNAHRPEEVETQLDLTLSQLGVDYLDLYLIHWPISFPPGGALSPLDPARPGECIFDPQDPSLVETWKAMIALPKSKVRAVGVSNFTVDHIKTIIKETGVKPAVNQIEAHPLLPQDDLVEYCKEQGIVITAYSALGNNLIGEPLLTEHPVVKEVAAKLGATEAQVLIAWGVYRGYIEIPKSVTESRIISNFQQIELSKEDYEKIGAIGHGKYRRYNIPNTYKPKWSINLFDEELEKDARHNVRVV